MEAVHSGRWGSSLDVRGTFHVVPLRRPGAFKEGCSMRHETFFNGLPDSVAQGAQPVSTLAGGKAQAPGAPQIGASCATLWQRTWLGAVADRHRRRRVANRCRHRQQGPVASRPVTASTSVGVAAAAAAWHTGVPSSLRRRPPRWAPSSIYGRPKTRRKGRGQW